jgi:hypothetical protein
MEEISGRQLRFQSGRGSLILLPIIDACEANQIHPVHPGVMADVYS